MKKKAKSQENDSSEKITRSYDPYFISEALFRSVDSIELSVRTANLLHHMRIRTIGELVQKTEQELLSTKWMGRKSLAELKEIITEMGLSFGMKLENFQFDSKEESQKYEFVAIGLFGDRLKLVFLHRDGRFAFMDELHSYGGLYVVTSETLRLKQAVEELETLINDQRTKESDLQDFFQRNSEFILNDEYKRAHSKIVLEKREDKTLIPDFILEPYDRPHLCDILDLKLPSAKVWILKKNRPRFSAAVYEACAQLGEYSQFFEEEENRLRILDKYSLLAYKPKLFVIIGRRQKVDPITKRRIEGNIPGVSVLTYDDLIEKIKRRIMMKQGEIKVG
jgi:hypothetical protein